MERQRGPPWRGGEDRGPGCRGAEAKVVGLEGCVGRAAAAAAAVTVLYVGVTTAGTRNEGQPQVNVYN